MNAYICVTLTRLVISDCYGDECIMTLLNLMVFEVREQSLKFSLDGMSPISLTNSSFSAISLFPEKLWSSILPRRIIILEQKWKSEHFSVIILFLPFSPRPPAFLIILTLYTVNFKYMWRKKAISFCPSPSPAPSHVYPLIDKLLHIYKMD